MTVYVDALRRWKSAEAAAARVGARNDHQWCHMIADTLEELHELARRIGLRREWFQPSHGGHYDLTPARREAAIAAGAVAVDRKAFVTALRRIRATRRAA